MCYQLPWPVMKACVVWLLDRTRAGAYRVGRTLRPHNLLTVFIMHNVNVRIQHSTPDNFDNFLGLDIQKKSLGIQKLTPWFCSFCSNKQHTL